MRIGEIIQAQDTAISFEFFPPKTDAGWEKLFKTISHLVPLSPSFVSVTYGAGGTTRQRTHELVTRLKRQTSLPIAAHLTCVGSQREEIKGILARYADLGIDNIMALRGDHPKDEPASAVHDFPYATDLVRFIRQEFPQVHLGVAGYPEGHPDTPNRLLEMDYLKAKIDAGADYIITQLFFDNRDFYDFCERCDMAGIHVPIIAGIMPVTSLKGMRRMADLARGSRFPAGLLRSLERAQGDDYVKRVGVHWAAEQVRDLIDNRVAGVHFYTLNAPDASLRICETLGLRDFSEVIGPDVETIRETVRSRRMAALMMQTDI
jgi:methylenetetrahydrofolate reductase (NADPH)